MLAPSWMSRDRDVIYNNIPVGVAGELYLFPEMETNVPELLC